MIGLGLADGRQGLVGIGAHGYLGHIDVAVAHGNLRQGLLGHHLTGGGELRHLADVGGLGGLAAGVGIHLGVKDHHVDVLAGGQDMVQTAEADIVGPAVAAEDPHGLLGEVLLVGQNLCRQGAGLAVAVGSASGLEGFGMGLHLAQLVAEDAGGGGAGQERQALVHGHDGVLEDGDVLLGGLGVGGAVLHGIQPLLGGGLQLGHGVVNGDEGAGLVGQALADGLLAQVHAQTVLGVVLEEGVGPGGAMAALVHGVGGGSGGAAPDGGTAGGVGDVHPVAADLGDEAAVSGLGAAGAGAGELKQRLLELAALDGLDIGHVVLDGDLGDHIIEHVLLGGLGLLGHHGQGLHRADLGADRAAHAVQGADGDGKLVLALAGAGLEGDLLGLGGCIGGLGLVQRVGADGGVGADVGALVALDALVLVPGGNADGHAALLVGAGALLEGAVHMVHEGGDGEAVAVHLGDGLQDALHHLHSAGAALQLHALRLVLGSGPGGGHVELLEGGDAQINGLVVHIHHVLALLQVGVGGGILHVADGLSLRHDLRQLEESGLENGVGALAHADLGGQVDGVDGVDLDVVLGNIALGHGGHVVIQLLVGPLAVDEEHAAVLHVADHGEALDDVRGHMAGHEVGLVDVVGALDGLVAEAQVADGHAAGLLGVVLEVRLDKLIGVVADDFDGVLVGADGAVAAQAPELALDGALGRSVGGLVLGQGGAGHVVHDADGELALGLVLLELLIHGEDAAGGRVLGAQAVAAAHDGGLTAGVGERGDHVQVQGVALAAGLLGAVQDGDLLRGLGDGGQELVGAEGAVQADLHQADLLTVGVEVVDDLLGHVVDGAHGDDDAVGVGSAIVVEGLVVGAQLGVDLVHVLLNDGGELVVVLVAGLAVLEEDVAVLVGAAHHGTLGVQRALAERLDGVHIHHIGQILVVPDLDLLDLVGGPEAVKEVHEGHAALDGGQMGDGAQVHNLLGIGLGQHGKAGLAAGHHVGVVAEDVQGLGGHGTGGHVEHAGEQLAGDLVHVGDHQQQALGSGVSSGQGARVQGAVDRAGGACLGLHLDNLHGVTEDVLAARGGPLVDAVRHGAGRSDGVDARHLGERVRYVRGRGVTVHCLEFSRHFERFLLMSTCAR